MTYEFKSPAALADYLEGRADEMTERARSAYHSGSMTQRDMNLFEREAAGIRSAANILRNCNFYGKEAP